MGYRLCRFVGGLTWIAILWGARAASADSFDTSLSPGSPTGGGAQVAADQYLAVRFQLVAPTSISSIGFRAVRTVPSDTGNLFGALIALDSGADFPDSANPLSTPDVLAHTEIAPPPSGQTQDISAPIGPIILPAGNYALMFGAGSYGTTGNVSATQNNPQSGSYSYFFWNSSNGFYTDGGFGNVRFFYNTPNNAPEPTTIALLSLAAPLVLLRRRRHR